MTTVADQRREKLQAICAHNSWGPSDLARQVGSGTPAYWSDLLRGKKSFGEKLARKIETGLLLELGFLDQNAPEKIRDMTVSPRILRVATALDALPEGVRKDTIIELIESALSISGGTKHLS